MKTLTLNQMGEINGSFDCSVENQLSFVGGWVVGGLIFGGGFGYLGGLVVSSSILLWKCPGKNH